MQTAITGDPVLTDGGIIDDCPLAIAGGRIHALGAAGLVDRGRLADLLLVETGPPPRLRAVWIGGREVARFP